MAVIEVDNPWGATGKNSCRLAAGLFAAPQAAYTSRPRKSVVVDRFTYDKVEFNARHLLSVFALVPVDAPSWDEWDEEDIPNPPAISQYEKPGMPVVMPIIAVGGLKPMPVSSDYLDMLEYLQE